MTDNMSKMCRIKLFKFSDFSLMHLVAGNLDIHGKSAYSALFSQFMSLHTFLISFLFAETAAPPGSKINLFPAYTCQW